MTIERRDMQALISEMRTLAGICERHAHIPCQNENAWHARQYREWADRLDALSRVETPQEDMRAEVLALVDDAISRASSPHSKLAVLKGLRERIERRLTPRDPAPSERKDEAND